jgi:hypothetical protein
VLRSTVVGTPVSIDFTGFVPITQSISGISSGSCPRSTASSARSRLRWRPYQVHQCVGFAAIGETVVNVTPTAVSFSNDDWVWGGVAQVGASYALGPRWFLDRGYTHARSPEFKIRDSRAFSNKNGPLASSGVAFPNARQQIDGGWSRILRFVFPGVKWRSGLSFRLAPNDHHGGRDASGPSYADHGRAACLNALPSTAFDTPSEGRRCACIGVRQCDEMLKSGDCKSDPRCDNGELGAIVCSCKAVRTSRYDSLRLTPLRGT